MERDILAVPHAHPQLQPIEPIQRAYPLAVQELALASEKDPNALMPKSGRGVRQIAIADPPGRMILGMAASMPRRATKLCQSTGPCTTHLKHRPKPLDQLSAAGGLRLSCRASESTCLSSGREATNRFKPAAFFL